jgi:hypothetical protein
MPREVETSREETLKGVPPDPSTSLRFAQDDEEEARPG